MKLKAKLLATAAAAVTAVALVPVGAAQAHDPTCADFGPLDIEVHGQHVVRDYVIEGALEWPPAGAVGEAIGGEGAAIPGGPGPGAHFPNVAPGASFCNAQSQSPGFHVGS